MVPLSTLIEEQHMRGHKDMVTQDRLKELLTYDPETGLFTAASSRRGVRKGTPIGCYFARDDSMLTTVDGRQYAMANLAWLYVYGEWPVKQLLKLDGDGRNLAIRNLSLPIVGRRGELTQDRLKAVLGYNCETGVFTWLIRPAKNVPAGSVAGKDGKGNGYLYIAVDGVEYTNQRLAWLYVHGEWPKNQLRFRDGDQNNVAIGNLFESIGEFATRAEQDKHWRQRNPDKVRGITLKKDFGITVETYHRLLEGQGGVCASCKNPETATRNGNIKWLAVDHCHDSHVLRGLLCAACNMAIGMMNDDPARLRAAADYLDRSRALVIDDPATVKLVPRTPRVTRKKEAA
jgi:hypothetical protein